MWKILISIPLVTEAQNVFLAVDYASKWDQENNCGFRPQGPMYPAPEKIDENQSPMISSGVECNIVGDGEYVFSYKCSSPCQTDAAKTVTLTCDCFDVIGPIKKVKDCEWKWADDNVCPEVPIDEQYDWECNPNNDTCKEGQYPSEETTTTTAKSAATTAKSTTTTKQSPSTIVTTENISASTNSVFTTNIPLSSLVGDGLNGQISIIISPVINQQIGDIDHQSLQQMDHSHPMRPMVPMYPYMEPYYQRPYPIKRPNLMQRPYLMPRPYPIQRPNLMQRQYPIKRTVPIQRPSSPQYVKPTNYYAKPEKNTAQTQNGRPYSHSLQRDQHLVQMSNPKQNQNISQKQYPFNDISQNQRPLKTLPETQKLNYNQNLPYQMERDYFEIEYEEEPEETSRERSESEISDSVELSGDSEIEMSGFAEDYIVEGLTPNDERLKRHLFEAEKEIAIFDMDVTDIIHKKVLELRKKVKTGHEMNSDDLVQKEHELTEEREKLRDMKALMEQTELRHNLEKEHHSELLFSEKVGHDEQKLAIKKIYSMHNEQMSKMQEMIKESIAKNSEEIVKNLQIRSSDA